jgi:DNA-binding transcriptional regulator YiaG
MRDQFWEIYKKCEELTDKLLEAAADDKEKQKEAYARKLRDYRIAENLTQDELAKRLNVTKMEILRWENKKNIPSQLAIDKMKQLKIL